MCSQEVDKYVCIYLNDSSARAARTTFLNGKIIWRGRIYLSSGDKKLGKYSSQASYLEILPSGIREMFISV